MQNILMIVQIVSAISLITLIMLQTPKTDGLTALGADSSNSEYKGKLGKEEILGTYTKYAAIAFFVASLLVVIIK